MARPLSPSASWRTPARATRVNVEALRTPTIQIAPKELEFMGELRDELLQRLKLGQQLRGRPRATTPSTGPPSRRRRPCSAIRRRSMVRICATPMGRRDSLRLGRAATDRVLIVVYTVRRRGDGESFRMIGARRASRKERAAYAASRD
jgi:hypothetical protein